MEISHGRWHVIILLQRVCQVWLVWQVHCYACRIRGLVWQVHCYACRIRGLVWVCVYSKHVVLFGMPNKANIPRCVSYLVLPSFGYTKHPLEGLDLVPCLQIWYHIIWVLLRQSIFWKWGFPPYRKNKVPCLQIWYHIIWVLLRLDILPTAKAGGFCGQTAIAAEGSLTSPSARENALSLWKFSLLLRPNRFYLAQECFLC